MMVSALLSATQRVTSLVPGVHANCDAAYGITAKYMHSEYISGAAGMAAIHTRCCTAQLIFC